MSHILSASMRSHRTAILIAIIGGLLAFVLRWYYLMHAQVLQPLDDPNVSADAAEYYRYAWNLVHHGAFANDLPDATVLHPNSFRDPGYAAFLGLWMLMTSSYGGWYAGVLLSQALLGGLTVTVLALTMRGRLPNGGLAAAVLLMAVWPHSVVAPSFVLSETLFGFLCAVSLLCVRMTMERPRYGLTILTGIALGAAALTNAILVPFGALFAVTLFWRKDVTARVALTLACASLLLPLAWGIRGQLIPPTEGASHRVAMNLVQGSWPTYHAAYQLAMKGDEAGVQTIKAIDAEIARFGDGILNGLSGMGKRIGFAPLTYVGWYLRKPALLWGWDIRIGQGDIYVYPTRNSPFVSSPGWRVAETACFLINPFLMLLAALGAITALARRTTDPAALGAVAMVLWATLIYGVLQSEPRYSTPFRGMEIMLAAIGVATLASALARYRNRRTTAVTLSS
jgi:hypothetical protein